MGWRCPICQKYLVGRSPAGTAISADNHLRSHRLNSNERRKILDRTWPPKRKQ